MLTWYVEGDIPGDNQVDSLLTNSMQTYGR